jgi:hypothetical protein
MVRRAASVANPGHSFCRRGSWADGATGWGVEAAKTAVEWTGDPSGFPSRAAGHN